MEELRSSKLPSARTGHLDVQQTGMGASGYEATVSVDSDERPGNGKQKTTTLSKLTENVQSLQLICTLRAR